MAITYYKRFRMEIDLDGPPGSAPGPLPPPYAWVGWDEALLERHAEVKFLASTRGSTPTSSPAWGNATGASA